MGLGARVNVKWVSLDVISERMNIYCYLHIAKNAYPQDDS
jgi:hypothetical protein